MIDCIIVGKGPAGISASIYLARANLNCLVIAKGYGALEKADKIENYYGLEQPVSGIQLAQKGIRQAQRLGVSIITEEVVAVEWNEHFIVKTERSSYLAKTIILATGIQRKQPMIKGIKELEGKGVSYCAVCDSFFYKGKDVAVLGSGEYAENEIRELLPVVNSVTMVTNGEQPMEHRSSERNIIEKEIRQVRGEDKVQEIEFQDHSTLKIDGLFVAVGMASSTDLARKIGAATSEKAILVDEKMRTTVPGLYACGDCTGGVLQISKAIYEGTKAALEVIREIREAK